MRLFNRISSHKVWIPEHRVLAPVLLNHLPFLATRDVPKVITINLQKHYSRYNSGSKNRKQKQMKTTHITLANAPQYA